MIGLGSTLGVMGFRSRHLCSGGIIPGGGLTTVPCTDVASRMVPFQGFAPGSAPLNAGAPIVTDQAGTVQLDVSLAVSVLAGETLSVRATLDGVAVGPVLLTYTGPVVAFSQSAIAAVAVPDGTHVVGLEVTSSGVAQVNSGTVVARGCLTPETVSDQG